ncbi:MAG TPA: hypothetical protein DCS16_00170 [Gammaproteobacteria bacterium]|nr:hypothetical protein [Gammaproteobacteria bacterium]
MKNGNETLDGTDALEDEIDGEIDASLDRTAEQESKEGQSDLSAAELAQVLISAEEVLVNDYPLNEALNVLKGINAYKPLSAKRAALGL